MMKYAVNHYELFTNVHVAFFIAWLHTFSSFTIEICVVVVLTSFTNVLEVIMKYVSLAAISNIPRFYYNSLVDQKLLEIAGSHKLIITNYRCMDRVKDAPCAVRIMRIIYKSMRVVFCCMSYYFLPFSALFITYFSVFTDKTLRRDGSIEH